MNLKTALPLVFITAFGCSTHQTSELTQLNRDTSITVHTMTNPSTVILHITGVASDTFLIEDYTKVPGGQIDTVLQHDYYDKEYVLSYKHYKADSGRLKIVCDLP